MNDATFPAAAPRARHPLGRALRLLGAWLALVSVLIGLTVGWVALYSYAIDPGHPASYYEAYAQRAGPVVGLLLSAPVFGLLGYVCTRRAQAAGARFALHATLLYLVLDAAIVAIMVGAAASAWGTWIAAAALALAGLQLGGQLGARAARARA